MRTFGDYRIWNRLFKHALINNISVSSQSENLAAILLNHPKLVVAINHGPTIAPGIVNMALIDLFLKNGGADRTHIAVIWKYFYKVPVIRRMASYITQIDKAYTFDQFLKAFQQQQVNDLMVMPEGENCNFGNGIDIEPFLSPRFMEFAIRSNVPVLIAVHYGSQILQKSLPIHDQQMKYFKWLPQKDYLRLAETKRLSIPKLPKHQKASIWYSFKLYQPQITADQLSNDDKERDRQLWHEAETVRQLMQTMVGQMHTEACPSFMNSGVASA